MTVNISDSPGRVNRKKVKAAVKFYAEFLMSRRLANNLRIDVKFGDLIGHHDCEAMVNWEDCNWRPRWFTIQLDKTLGMRTMLILLAHEMVHVKQHATGEARDNLRKPNLFFWHGKTFDSTDVDYYDLPWEIEAFGREQGLYNRFKEKYRVDRKAQKTQKPRSKRTARPAVQKANREKQKSLR